MKTFEIMPQVYQLTTRGVNIILIAEQELTLIDAGFRGSSRKVADFISSLGRSVEEISLIIITHNHFDHIGGVVELRRLAKVRVAAHKADMLDADGELPYPAGRRISTLLSVPPFSALRRRLALMSDDIDIKLEGGEVLKPLGGLEVIHTPGHTPGSIGLYSQSHKLLIVGDTLVSRGKFPDLPHKMVSTHFTQAVDSIKKMAQLDFDVVCFGHGPPINEDARNKLLSLVEKAQG